MLHLKECFQNAIIQQINLIQNETKNVPGGISLFLLWKAGFWAISFFSGDDPPPLFLTAWRGAAQLNKRLKEKAIRKLERVAARQQMLLPYKLVEDYAWPAVPYKCPVLYHTMTHCVYHMVQHLVNSVPNSHISIQTRHWLGFIYVYDSISIKIPFWGLNSLQQGREFNPASALCCNNKFLIRLENHLIFTRWAVAKWGIYAYR